MHAGENPFSVQRIQALPRFAAENESLEACGQRFWQGVDEGRRVQVISGPHGSGKSRLLRELGTLWAGQGVRVQTLKVSAGGQTRVVSELPNSSVETPTKRQRGGGVGGYHGRRVLLIDSGEHLRGWRWHALRLRFGGCPCLMTRHHAAGWTVLHTLEPDWRLFLRMFNYLLFGEDRDPLDPRWTWGAERLGLGARPLAELQALFAASGGDLRRSFQRLFELAADAPPATSLPVDR